ncbi:MAG: ABC transporter permease [Thermoanaerobaculales bacterium]
MIGTVVRVAFTNLRRDRVAQALTFVLPIVFFSIFAVIFGSSGNRQVTPHVSVAVVDEDGSELSRRLVAGLTAETALRVHTTWHDEKTNRDLPLDRERARALVHDGTLPVAVILPKGLSGAAGFVPGSGAKVQLLADVSDPLAAPMVEGLLQKVAMTAAPDIMMGNGLTMFERYAGSLTPEQHRAVDSWLPRLKESAQRPPGAAADTSKGATMQGLIGTEVVDVMREKDVRKPFVSFYAAGIGVMFLLFSAAGGGGALLDEVDSGTLERLLSSRLGMRRLLLGKWLYLTLLGFAQLLVMFTWGAVVFGLPLVGHFGGFALVTVFTAAAAGGFGLVLASACRTRAQLGGLSTIVILVMSALGGSMFPRFLMPEGLQKVGLLTFNGWALDAYLKVFWREEPLVSLAPQLGVLAGLAIVFLALTRVLARRWERA